ncbi:hypothetical protein [Pontibacter sp. G13]|uniref:hypothetical protein n=1 Tax=Pontibacter sp. G13 TaxID=3074898 RepID=UPI002889A6B0|nr:hypothetical protein [Pontibacter sp. G13]WNJ17725.1 hypothetical protein RJD25_22975 [Pontibacter sp. G13]
MFFKRRENELLEAHSKIGFPKIPRREQCRMILRNDFSPISKLTPIGKCDRDLLNYYFNISYRDLAEYILDIGYLDKCFLKEEVRADGVWILRNETGSFEILDQERGNSNRTLCATLFDVAIYYSRINLNYIPKYFENDFGIDVRPNLYSYEAG